MLLKNGMYPLTRNPGHVCGTINTLKLFVVHKH